MANRPAFSLIELVVVVVVIATVFAVAVPRLGDGQTQYRLDLATRQVAEDIEQAREAARYESVAKSLTFDPVTSAYFLWSGLPVSLEAIVGELDVAEVDGELSVETGAGSLFIHSPPSQIHRLVRTSPAVRMAYTDQDVLLARQVILTEAPFRAMLLDANFSENRTLSFSGHGMPLQGGSITVAVGNRSSQLLVDPLTGAVTVSRLTLSATTEMLLNHSNMLLSSTGRTVDDLLGTGSTVEDTVQIVSNVSGGILGGATDLLTGDGTAPGTGSNGSGSGGGGILGGILNGIGGLFGGG